MNFEQKRSSAVHYLPAYKLDIAVKIIVKISSE